MSEASKKIDDYLSVLPLWQQDNLVRFRQLIHEVEPSIEEAWKWSVPVFLFNGTLAFAMSAFKAHTKYNFILNGALLADEDQLFNNGLDSKTSRGIDLPENAKIDEVKLRTLLKKSLEKANSK